MIGMKGTLDTVLVKAPHRKETFTEQELEEFARCADPVNGPMYFLDNFFYIQHPVRGKMLYHPFEYQRRLIDNYHNNRFSISLMPRQTGKSTSAAGYLLWYAMFVPDSTILIAAHKYLGAQEIMQRIRYAYELCPNHIRAGATSYNKGSLEFDNGSRIVSQTTTENTGRGARGHGPECRAHPRDGHRDVPAPLGGRMVRAARGPGRPGRDHRRPAPRRHPGRGPGHHAEFPATPADHHPLGLEPLHRTAHPAVRGRIR